MGAFGEPVCPDDADLAGFLPLYDAVDVDLHFASQFVAIDAGTFSSPLQDTRLQAYFGPSAWHGSDFSPGLSDPL